MLGVGFIQKRRVPQPRVVQLYVREADSPFLSARGLAMEVRQGRPGVSVPLALWHQDTSFLYVAPMSTQNPGAARLTANPAVWPRRTDPIA
jgi:hypothetical protein